MVVAMENSTIPIGTRFQKTAASKKIYRVVSTVSRSYQPPHVQLSAETDPTEVITISSSSLLDIKFWKRLD